MACYRLATAQRPACSTLTAKRSAARRIPSHCPVYSQLPSAHVMPAQSLCAGIARLAPHRPCNACRAQCSGCALGTRGAFLHRACLRFACKTGMHRCRGSFAQRACLPSVGIAAPPLLAFRATAQAPRLPLCLPDLIPYGRACRASALGAMPAHAPSARGGATAMWRPARTQAAISPSTGKRVAVGQNTGGDMTISPNTGE